MKKHRILISIIITFFLVFNFPIFSPNVVAIAPRPDQFIGEIFPNSTIQLQLIHTYTLILFNATDFSHFLGIDYDANYTIYNPGNISTLTIIVPFSLALGIKDLVFEVHMNDTQIPYDLYDATPWNENKTEIDVSFLPRWINIYPITLIRSNITFLENSTSVIRYRFIGSMSIPSEPEDLFYITYHLGSWQDWIGNTSGKIELRAYGKQPIFSTSGSGDFTNNRRTIDINSGKSFSHEWHNIHAPLGNVGVKYYRSTPQIEFIMDIIRFQILPFTGIAIIVIIVIVRKKRNKRELEEIK